jgi:hypothetical protein
MMDRVLPIGLAILVAGLSLFSTVTFVRLKNEQAAHARTSAAHSHMVSALESQRASEEAKRRKAEQELNDGVEKHGKEVQALKSALDRSRAAGRDVAERMRNAASDAAERARAQCANTTPTELRTTADDPIGVLAHVLQRADERADLLATVADDRYAAGKACERRYDEAREKLMAY